MYETSRVKLDKNEVYILDFTEKNKTTWKVAQIKWS